MTIEQGRLYVTMTGTLGGPQVTMTYHREITQMTLTILRVSSIQSVSHGLQRVPPVALLLHKCRRLER